MMSRREEPTQMEWAQIFAGLAILFALISIGLLFWIFKTPTILSVLTGVMIGLLLSSTLFSIKFGRQVARVIIETMGSLLLFWL